MGLAAHLYKLQQLDLDLQRGQQELAGIEAQLSDNRALVAAEARLTSQQEQLSDIRKRQRTFEWELEDLQEKVKQVDGRLYGGTTKNPKELVNLEMELKNFKSQIRPKEDVLLGLMSQAEEMEGDVRNATEEVARLRREWEHRQETMARRKTEVETMLAELRGNRERLAQQVTPQALGIYERTRLTRGQAVAKVERGKCQGCHITLPSSQWQKAKAGDLVQCTSCSRILYLE
ncbi:MAG: zinc ribbon domain-containing protein [Dehalococcoidia bacterium]